MIIIINSEGWEGEVSTSWSTGTRRTVHSYINIIISIILISILNILIIIAISIITIYIIAILSNKDSATTSPYSTDQDHQSRTTYSLMQSYTGKLSSYAIIPQPFDDSLNDSVKAVDTSDTTTGCCDRAIIVPPPLPLLHHLQVYCRHVTLFIRQFTTASTIQSDHQWIYILTT